MDISKSSDNVSLDFSEGLWNILATVMTAIIATYFFAKAMEINLDEVSRFQFMFMTAFFLPLFGPMIIWLQKALKKYINS